MYERDSIAVVAEDGGDRGFGISTGSVFKKEGVNCALIEDVLLCLLMRALIVPLRA